MKDLERHVERQLRAQERQLVAVRLVMVALAAVYILVFREQLPTFPLLIGLLGVVTAYSLAVPLLLRGFPAREVGIVVTALDMAAVTVAVYAATDAIDAYLFYLLVILGVALRFGLAASVWSALVVSGMYLSVVIATADPDSVVRQLLPVRIASLTGFGIVAGLFSRFLIGRVTENARLQSLVAEEERERERTRERELLSRLGRDFAASLERDQTVASVLAGATPLLGEATLLYLLDDAAERLQPAGAAGPDADLAERLQAFAADRLPRLGEGAAGSAAATVTTVIVNASGSARGDPDGVTVLGVAWLLAVPIAAGGRVLGALVTVGRKPESAPPDGMRRMAEAIAERAGPALQNARLWADLQEQMAREQRATRIKDDFLSIVSHELRTPLTSIQGYSQLLEQRLRSGGYAEGKEMAHLRVVRSQVGRMRRLVDDLLDVSRIDRRGGVSIEPADIDLADLIGEAAARLRRAHPDRVVEVDVLEPLPVRADRDRIDQVLTNLLDNAVKYSPDGSPVGISGARLGNQVEISVVDVGTGIPPEHIENVFERFYQASDDAGRRRFGGLGLGLYISHAIIEAHGGRIHATANPSGRGTIFTFRIPRIAVPHHGPDVAPTGEPPPFVLRRLDGPR